MSSESEKRCSMEELKKLNLPPEQIAPPMPVSCPTEEQWEKLLGELGKQNRLLAAQSNMLNTLLTTAQTVSIQAEKQTKELLNIRQQLEQAGKPIYKNVLGKTQAEAKEKLKKIIEDTKGLDIVKAGEYTVGQWMEVWFENYAMIKVRPSSHQTYRGYLDHHINSGKVPMF